MYASGHVFLIGDEKKNKGLIFIKTATPNPENLNTKIQLCMYDRLSRIVMLTHKTHRQLTFETLNPIELNIIQNDMNA